MICRNIFSWIRPLRVADSRKREYSQGQDPATLQQVLHKTSLAVILSGLGSIGNGAEHSGRCKTVCAAVYFSRTKKDGTNGLAVRAGRPVTQTTSGREETVSNHLNHRNKYSIA